MRKYILDFEFDEVTGESRIVIDLLDDSMSAMEMNQSIRAGEVREEILNVAGKLFGEEVARQAREGKIGLVCLDDHPEMRQGGEGVPVSQDQSRKQDLEQ